IGIPYEYAVNTSEFLVQTIKIVVNSIDTPFSIEEVSLFDHHLNADKVMLRPLQFRTRIVCVVITHANQPFTTPMLEIGKPCLKVKGRTRSGNLRILRRVGCVLNPTKARRY